MLELMVIENLAMRKFLPAIVGVATLIGLCNSTVTVAGADTSGVLFAQRRNCTNPQTQGEINACAGLSYEKADKKLNQVYQQLLPELPRARRQKLITAQSEWIKFRDANCDFAKSEVQGGTIAPAIYNGCLADMTKQRTAQLERYLRDLK